MSMRFGNRNEPAGIALARPFRDSLPRDYNHGTDYHATAELMVLTKAELLASLEHEVRILLHLATKIDREKLDYRPTPGQRSTLELLQYLTIMGPELLDVAISGTFNADAWTGAENIAYKLSFDETLDALAKQPERYARALKSVSDEAMRGDVDIFAVQSSRGSFIVNQVLCAHAAYRTQLFVYLKACGRTELSTMNLWGGMDPT